MSNYRMKNKWRVFLFETMREGAGRISQFNDLMIYPIMDIANYGHCLPGMDSGLHPHITHILIWFSVKSNYYSLMPCGNKDCD